MSKQKNFKWTLSIAIVVLICLFFASFLVGRFKIPIKTVVDILFQKTTKINPYWKENMDIAILQVRLPRILLAIMAGGALSISGASYQTLFKNPMVSPDILGVSAGAGFGAALAMILSLGWLQIQTFAFVFGIVAVALTYILAKLVGIKSVNSLILSGIVISSIFQALISIIKIKADTENQLPSITFWLLGSFEKTTMLDVKVVFFPMLISIMLLFVFRNQINTLSAGEDEARTMGVNVELVKLIVVVSSTILTVTVVSVCGIIGWVGMIIPHLARLFVGASYSKLATFSFVVGGIFLLSMDNLIRGVSGAELPIGTITALIGSPIFGILLIKNRKREL